MTVQEQVNHLSLSLSLKKKKKKKEKKKQRTIYPQIYNKKREGYHMYTFQESS